MKQKEPEEPLRGSREASLGADGLHVSKATDTMPSRAPDDERPSAYADADADAAPEDEFHASREASLGGTPSVSRPAGGLAPEDQPLPPGAVPGDPDPERDWANDAGKS